MGIEGAARGGHKDLVEFFIEKGTNTWNQWNLGILYAKEGGYKDLVEFFSKNSENEK